MNGAHETFAYARSKSEVDAAVALGVDVIILQEKEWEDAKGYHLFSPTQIDGFNECERKWAWRKIEKIYVPQNASAALGSRVHKILERYVGEGVKPDFVTDGEAAHIASSAMHLLGTVRAEREKDKEAVLLEGEFRFQSEKTGFVYHGIRDLSIRPGVVIPELEIDGKAPVVGDYKTTKSINDYAKSKDDLEFDVQSTLYGYDAMARWRMPFADLRWIYMQTKGTRKSHVVPVRLTSAQAIQNFSVIESIARRMATALDKGKRPLELAPNPAACGNFGGCPYRHLCNDLTSSQKAKAKVSNSVIANLRARVQGQTPPAIEEKKDPEQKPDVMGRAAEDVPAPTEIPKWMTEKKEEPVQVNPPESTIAPTPSAPIVETKTEEKPKTTRGRKPKAPEKDPLGADVHMHTSNGADKAVASGVTVTVPSNVDAKQVVESIKKELEETIAATTREGFTLYVDCLPIGRAPRTFATFIEKAQTKILETQGVGDYRLIDYGKGAALFLGFVVEQIEGFQGELFLDTRTPEGAVLLETVSGMATNVVRGLR